MTVINAILKNYRLTALIYIDIYMYVLCSKYRYDDVSSQRFNDTSIDTAGLCTPLHIYAHHTIYNDTDLFC